MKYVEKSKIPQNSYIGYVESIDGRQAFWPWKVSADKYFYLKDGTMVSIGWISNLDCNGDYQGKKIVCSDFWIVFPKKSKMKIGVDVFNFFFTTEGFKPNATHLKQLVVLMLTAEVVPLMLYTTAIWTICTKKIGNNYFFNSGISGSSLCMPVS